MEILNEGNESLGLAGFGIGCDCGCANGMCINVSCPTIQTSCTNNGCSS